MSRLAPALFALLLLVSAAEAATPGGAASFDVLWEGRAWEVELVDGVAVALEADLLHVTGLDAKTGKWRWRRRVQKAANGFHTLSVIDGRVFFWAGPTLYELSPKTGKVLRQGEIVHNRQECALVVRAGHGAASCDVGLWLFGLDPITLGPFFGATEIHMYEDLAKPHTTHYLRSARTLLGVVGGRAVVAIEDKSDKRNGLFQGAAVLAAADPKSGELAWKTSELVRSGLTSGGVLDGRVAWVVSESTRAVGAVDATTGALVWKVAAAEDGVAPFNGDVFGDDATVVVLVDDVVTWRDLRTGEERWQAPAEGVTRVVALGGRGEPYVYGGEKPLKLGLATPGGKLVVVELPPYARAGRDGDALALVFAGHVRRYDRQGKLVSEVTGPPGGSFTLTGGAVGGIGDGQEVVYTRAGHFVAGLPEETYLAAGQGDVAVVMTRPAERGQAGTARLVLLKDPPRRE